MRLAYIANLINGTTGLERMILYQANYFIEHFNYDVNIILLDQKSDNKKRNFEINEKVQLHYLDIYKTGITSYLAKVKGINKSLEKIRPNAVVVCIDEVFGLYLGRFIKKRYPLIYQRHTTRNLNLNIESKSKVTYITNSVKRFLIGKSGGGYDKFVVLSEEHKKDWPHLKNLHVISNPIILDIKEDKALLQNKTVIAVGRQSFVKGYDMLLKSWQGVIKKYPDWTLKIYGKHSRKLNLKLQAEELNLISHVDFHEHTKDIKSAYLDASLLVCSSRIEGFPLVIIEAMACGVPVISFDCPVGPRAIITNKEDGLLVEPNDTDQLAKSIINLIENEELRKEMGCKAQNNIQRFSPSTIMGQWKTLFESFSNIAK